MKKLGFVCLVLSLTLLIPTQILAKAHVDSKIAYVKSQAGKEDTNFAGSIRFVDTPGADHFSALEALGVEFFDFGQGRAGSRTVYPAKIPFSAVDLAADMPFVMSVECSWSPRLRPMLHYANQENEAAQVWQMETPGGGTVTGDGVTLLMLDAGTKVLHPHYFKQDGLEYQWFDCDQSGDLTPGDAVDVNQNGKADNGENLWYHEAYVPIVSEVPDRYFNDPSCYDVAFDFLFHDANNNLESDYGAPKYKEDDPCYGEQVFLTVDENKNNRLDPGESLLGLGESKIQAIHDVNGKIYYRGENLIKYPPGDNDGHGFHCGVIAGCGWPGGNIITGVAPGIEFLFFNLINGAESHPADANYVGSFEPGLAWGVSEGATVVNISAGDLLWQYLDGSSNFEIMVNEYSEDGVIIVNAAGNEGTSTSHSRFMSGEGQTLQFPPWYDLWISFLWRDEAELGLTLITPQGVSIPLPADGSNVRTGSFRIYSNYSSSLRGTHRLDLRIDCLSVGNNTLGGDWGFVFEGPNVEVHGWALDGDFDPGTWVNGWDTSYSVVWPATADAAISVVSYDQMFPETIGQINEWCSKGPRIDGEPAVDIAVPAHGTMTPYWYDPRGYSYTSGATSYSAPQVAGAAALMKQLFPDLTGTEFREAIHASALQDEFVDDPDVWGAGKLRIYAAIAPLLADKAAQTTPTHPEFQMSASPNPFNPETTIRCYLAAGEPARVRVFAVDGTEVWDAALPAGPAGLREVTWQGTDREGRGVASGVYFFHVKQGIKYAVTKATLVK